MTTTTTMMFGKERQPNSSERLFRRSRRSIVLCSSIIGFLLALLPFYQHYLFAGGGGWGKMPTTHGMMSSRETTTPATTKIHPATWQLLQERPESFWNCNLPETPCRYFTPRHFWGDAAAVINVTRADYKRLGGTNKNLPAMTALSWWYGSPPARAGSRLPPSNNLLLEEQPPPVVSLPHNLSFIHVHKCGGTTVKALLTKTKVTLVSNNNKRSSSSIHDSTGGSLRADLVNYKYSFGGGSAAQKERNQQRRQDHIEGMIQLQQQQQQQDAVSHDNKQQHQHQQSYYDSVVFTVVRDPLDRFVSAVQQVMHYHEDFRKACLKWTARSTLRCAIQYAQTTDYLRDVHLVPMATHFRLWDDDYEESGGGGGGGTGPSGSSSSNAKGNPSVKIAVIHLNDIHILAHYMSMAAVARNIKHNTNTTTTTMNSMPHGRDRSKVEYATSSILAHMSVPKDCTPDMIKELCQLYAVDVAFMASLGYKSQYCK